MKNQKKLFQFEFPLIIDNGKGCVGSIVVSGECYNDGSEAICDWEHYELVGKTNLTTLMVWLQTYGTTPIETALQQHIEAVMSGQIVTKYFPETLSEKAA